MNFENELVSGTFIKRYKRFFVDVLVNKKIITCHCPNTGSMMGLLENGNKVWISRSNNTKRKLMYTLQIIEAEGSKIGVNTHLTNKIAQEALKENSIKELKNLDIIETEKKYNENTRFDFFVVKNKKKIFVEVKNVTLSRKKFLAEFPDAITSRGAKHIKNLVDSIKRGYEAYLLFVIQRDDCKRFKIAEDIDSEYAKLLTNAIKNKLKIICYDCKFSSKGIKIGNKIKF